MPFYNLYFLHVGSVYCTRDVSNPTAVYVVQGGEAVLQCGFESNNMIWQVYSDGVWNNIADGGDVLNVSKYSTSKNSPTGQYYRFHILNVDVSDLKKYRCEGVVSGMIQKLYLQLILLGRCNYTSVICMVWKIKGCIVVGESRIMFQIRPL